SPAVMRLAQEHGIDPATAEGTGEGGRVTRKDMAAAVNAGPASDSKPKAERKPQAGPASTPPGVSGDGYQVMELSPMRRTIARNMQRSNVEAPQAWSMIEADVTGLVERRQREKAA